MHSSFGRNALTSQEVLPILLLQCHVPGGMAANGSPEGIDFQNLILADLGVKVHNFDLVFCFGDIDSQSGVENLSTRGNGVEVRGRWRGNMWKVAWNAWKMEWKS